MLILMVNASFIGALLGLHTQRNILRADSAARFVRSGTNINEIYSEGCAGLCRPGDDYDRHNRNVDRQTRDQPPHDAAGYRPDSRLSDHIRIFL